MKTEYRYILEKGSKKYYCPSCNRKSFKRYIDTVTGNQLPENFGRCDRENKCSYYLNPYEAGYNKDENKAYYLPPDRLKPIIKHDPVYFDIETFRNTLEPLRYDKNTFVQNLFKKFDYNDVIKAIQLYRLGTVANGYRSGAITFPFIDIKNNVHCIQVKQFDENNHTTGTDFLHSIIEKHHTKNNIPLPEWLKAYIKQDKKVSCLYGEHLLSKYLNNPVALFEAPKTAIYFTFYFGFPDNQTNYICLAVYNKSSLSFDKIKALQGRNVFVFPDLSKDGATFKEWENKFKEYEKQLPGTRFIISDLLEKYAPESDKINGNDIADLLIKYDWKQFRNETKEQEQQQIIKVEVKEQEQPENEFLTNTNNFETEIEDLEKYFNSISIPDAPINLNSFIKIHDVPLFVSSHLSLIKNYGNKKISIPYLKRLQEFKKILEKSERTIKDN